MISTNTQIYLLEIETTAGKKMDTFKIHLLHAQ